MTVYLEDQGGYKFPFPVEEQLNKLLAFVSNKLQCPYEVETSILLVDREEIHRLNKEFRGVDRPTDVLSFPMMEYGAPGDFESEKFQQTLTVSPETEELMLGDMVICSQVVCEQAKEYGHSLLREFSFLVVHSLLHLYGYDHIEEEDRIVMENLQKEIMQELKINR